MCVNINPSTNKFNFLLTLKLNIKCIFYYNFNTYAINVKLLLIILK